MHVTHAPDVHTRRSEIVDTARSVIVVAWNARHVGMNDADGDFDARIAAEPANQVFLDRRSIETHPVHLQVPRGSLTNELPSFRLWAEYIQSMQ